MSVAGTFATLVRLMPLEAGRPDPAGMPPRLVALKRRERSFLEQLMDISKLERCALPDTITATLRSYQQTGLDWMMFLNKCAFAVSPLMTFLDLQPLCAFLFPPLQHTHTHAHTHKHRSSVCPAE